MKVKSSLKKTTAQKLGPKKPTAQKLKSNEQATIAKKKQALLNSKPSGKKPQAIQDKVKVSSEASEPQAKPRDMKSFMDAWGIDPKDANPDNGPQFDILLPGVNGPDPNAPKKKVSSGTPGNSLQNRLDTAPVFEPFFPGVDG